MRKVLLISAMGIAKCDRYCKCGGTSYLRNVFVSSVNKTYLLWPHFWKSSQRNIGIFFSAFIFHIALSVYSTICDSEWKFLRELIAYNSSMEGLASSYYHLPDPSFHEVSERYTMNLVTAIINIVKYPLAVICNIFNHARKFVGCRLHPTQKHNCLEKIVRK